MLIDWFTVVAQIVNFLVLVVLMKRFLYGPLVTAIDTREQSIATRLADAATRERDAAARTEQLARDAADMDRQRAGTLAAAREDADRQRGEILAQARQSATELETKWRDELEREKVEFLGEVRSHAAAGILDAARSALRDLASVDIDRAATSCFLEKLRTVDPGLLRSMAVGSVTAFSRNRLPDEIREAVRQGIESRAGIPVTIAFECDPAMAWGIELRGNGQRIGWTPDAWLNSLSDKLRGVLERAETPDHVVSG